MDINILEIFNQYQLLFKQLYIKNGKINSKIIWKQKILESFPGFNDLLNTYGLTDYFREVMYCLLNDLSHIKKCAICGKLLHIKNYRVGFISYCSLKCVAKASQLNCPVKKSIKLEGLEKYSVIKDGNYYIIKEYSKYGDERIYWKTLKEIQKIGHGSFSYKLNEDIYNTYIPSIEDIVKFQNQFKDFYRKYSKRLNITFWIRYFPKELKIINTYFNTYVNDKTACLQEQYYFFLNKLTSRPICKHTNCTNCTKYSISGMGYYNYCDGHKNSFHHCSNAETEIESLLMNNKIIFNKNNRNIINKELDFYIKDYNIAIEFNGVYYHSTKFKTSQYHYNKFVQCANVGIKLISIWENDWNINKQYYKDIILKMCNKCQTINDYKIEVTTFGTANDFCKSILLNYKLNKNNTFISITNNNIIIGICILKFSKNGLEFIKYIEKPNIKVINGFTQSVEFIKQHFNIENILYYCDCDLPYITPGKVIKHINNRKKYNDNVYYTCGKDLYIL